MRRGEIGSVTDAIDGKWATNQYDSLKRLLSAAASGWAETYGYDAFGNLVAKTPTAGSPPTLSIAVNAANNQVVGYPYDANGNQLAAPALGTSPTLTYDLENRPVTEPGLQRRSAAQTRVERDAKRARADDSWRAHEWARGTQECVRHILAAFQKLEPFARTASIKWDTAVAGSFLRRNNLAEWSYVECDAAEGFCQLHYFAIKKRQDAGEIEFTITVREYLHPPDPAMKFFAQADKQTNQKTAPFTPVGWGQSISAALHDCVKAIRRFPYEP